MVVTFMEVACNEPQRGLLETGNIVYLDLSGICRDVFTLWNVTELHMYG